MFFPSQTTAKKSSLYDTDISGTNTVITLNAVPGNYYVIDQLTWSYSVEPVVGGISIVDNTASNAVLTSIDITGAGPGQLVYEGGFECPKSAQISIVMLDGTAVSKLTIGYR